MPPLFPSVACERFPTGTACGSPGCTGWRETIQQHCPSLVSLQSLVAQPQRALLQHSMWGGKPFGAQLTGSPQRVGWQGSVCAEAEGGYLRVVWSGAGCTAVLPPAFI